MDVPVVRRARPWQSLGVEPMRRSIEVAGPYRLVASLRLARFGRTDPTASVDGPLERFAKAARTPLGPVTLAAWHKAGGPVEVAIYGPGAEWVEARLRVILGVDDPATTFTPKHPRLAPHVATLHATRLGRAVSLSEWHAVVIMQQRVTFAEAAASYRRVCARVAEPAPGPLGLLLPPAPAHWAALHQPEARALGLDTGRWEALQHAARFARSLDAAADDVRAEVAREAVQALLGRCPGTGPWTRGLVLGLGLGDADAVVPGDVHLPHDVAAFFHDRPHGSDEAMLAELDPFRPHRFRVVRLILSLGRRKP